MKTRSTGQILTVHGTLTWAGGSMGGTGVTDEAPGAALDLAGGTQYTGLRTINDDLFSQDWGSATLFAWRN